MVANILLFFVLLTGSVFCTALFKRKFEESIPLTIFSIIIIIYFFGLFGFLKAGVYMVCFVCFILYVISITTLIKSKQFKQFIKNLLTPAFFIYFLYFIILYICNIGRLASSWDEFSHWADIVKVMFTINDFGTNPLSYSSFKSYPPAMAIFQYFFQVINSIISGTNLFSEWRLFFSYQIFFLSLLMPFLKGLTFKKISNVLIIGIILFLAPVAIYSEIYEVIYIDAFLGILAGFGMAIILTYHRNGIFETLTIIFTIFILVLTKDAGIIFAIFLAAIFIIEEVLNCNVFKNKNNIKNLTFKIGCSILPIIIAKISWKYNVIQNNLLVIFPNQINIKELFGVISGNDTGYKKEVLVNYINSMLTSQIQIGNTNISISYFNLFAVFLFLMFLIYIQYKKYNKENIKRYQAFFIALSIELIFYIVGLCIIYMFNFNQYQAVNLASFKRYFMIPFLMVWIVFMAFTMDFLKNNPKKSTKIAVLMLTICILMVPMSEVKNFILRSSVHQSQAIRAPYEQLSEETFSLIKKDEAKIYFIAQETTGFEYWVMRYSLRPMCFSDEFTWSIGEPFYDGDVWTKTIDLKTWSNEIFENYDYVLIYNVNQYFIDNFSDAFSDPKTISNKTIYKVNKATGLLDCLN